MEEEVQESHKDYAPIEDTHEVAKTQDPQKVEGQKCWWSINKPLLPLKVVLISWGAALATLLPYVTVHLRERGLTVAETTAIYTIQPVFQLLGPSLAGMIADKIGKYKPVLFASLLLTIASATGVLLIPRAPPPYCSYPADITLCTTSTPEIKVYAPDCENSYGGPLELLMSLCDLNCGSVEKTTRLQMCFVGESSRICDTISLQDDAAPPGGISVQVGPAQKGDSTCTFAVRSVKWKGGTVSDLQYSSCTNTSHNCVLTCQLQNEAEINMGESILHQPCNQEWKERLPTLVAAFVFVLLYFAFFNVSYRLLDVTAMVMANSNGSHLGREKIWEVLATAIFSPLSGIVVDAVSRDKGHIEYDAAFYMFNGLTALTAVFVVVLNISVAAPSKSIWRKSISILRKPHAFVFVLAILCMGAIWGFVIQFLAWFLAELDSDAMLIGLSRTVGGIAAIPVLLTAKWWISLLGEINIIIISFFVYLVRCIGYSYMENPWWYLIYDALKSISENLMWVAALTYCSNISPPGLLATIQGIIGGVHFGIGKGVGSTIGGVMETYGARATFRGVGIAAGAIGVLYAFTHYVILPLCKKEVKTTEAEGDDPAVSSDTSNKDAEDHPDETTPLLPGKEKHPTDVSPLSV